MFISTYREPEPGCACPSCHASAAHQMKVRRGGKLFGVRCLRCGAAYVPEATLAELLANWKPTPPVFTIPEYDLMKDYRLAYRVFLSSGFGDDPVFTAIVNLRS